MAGVSINLLPAQFRIDQKAQKKFQVVQAVSIFTLLTLILLASVTTAVRIVQNKELQGLKEEETQKEEQVLVYKEKEAALAILKNRLGLINQIVKSDSKSSRVIYKSVLTLMPPNIGISSVSLDRGGNFLTSILSPHSFTVDSLITSLTSEQGFTTISNIDLDNLSRSRDGSYRVNMRIGTQ